MLDGMRRMSQGIWGRIIMGLMMGFISVSFAIWGVGNIFVGYGAGTVAKVGGSEITVEAVRQLYQTQLQNLQRQARRSITNEQARQFGLDRQVLGQLIADATMDGRVNAYGLAMSDKAIARKALNDPTFFGPTGKFDQNRFNELLRDNGFSEQTFVREQRKLYLRQEIADAVTGDMQVPNATLDAIHRFRNETRSIEYFELPASAAGEIAPPDDAALQTYFESRKQNFRAPEYRRIVTLTVTPAQLVDAVAVSDDDARKLYETVKGQRFGAPAKREFQQLVFPDEGKAKEASDRIKAGASLADVAKDNNLTVADVGSVARTEIFDKAIADAVFALGAGAVSEPVKGQFGYSILRVVSASEENVKPFAEVVADLKGEIARDRARKTASDLRDKVEDERTSGKALEEAAAAAGLKATTIDAIDQNGRDRSGAEVALSERDALLRAVFASDIGVDNETINARDGGFVWFEVLAIDRARDQTLAEVKDKVVAAWREDEVARVLTDKAIELVKKIDGGASVEALAKELGLEAKNVADVRRVGTTSIPQAVIIRVFNLAVGQAGSATGDSQSRYVFKILDGVTPPLDASTDTMQQVLKQLKQSYSEDLLTEYLTKLQGDASVTINEAALRVATGAAAEGGDQ